MSRSLFRYTACLQIALVLFTGCAPTQPFFIAKDDALAHYLDQALAIEYADVQTESLPEARQAHQPLGPAHSESEFVDLTLEDCISMALQNAKILNVVSGSYTQTGSVGYLLLGAQPGQLPSVYDTALTASGTLNQVAQLDNQGNRVPFRGAVRSNQIGGVEDALSEFDAQFSSLLGYNTTDRPRNVQDGNPFNPQLFQAVDSNYYSALSKKMATGAVATLRGTTTYSYNNVQIGVGRAVPSDYTQTLEMQVTQPLLRGRGTLINRIPVVLARINEDISLHEFEGNVRNLVRATEDAYWDLYCGYRLVESAQQALDTSADLWRVAAARARAGGPPEAEAQARSLYNNFYSQLIAAKHGSTVPGNDPRGMYGREQVLREKMGWSSTDGRLIRPSDTPTEARIDFDWSDILAEGLVRNVDLRKEKWFIKSIEMELIAAKNQLLPQLDVSGTYRWVGMGDRWISKSSADFPIIGPGNSAVESLTDGNFQELGARVEFTPTPIGSRRALSGIKNREFALAKAHEELKNKEMYLVGELSFSWRNIDSTFEQIRIARDQWEATTDEIKVYRDKIEQNAGELPPLLDSLLRAEERRAAAQRTYYQALCEYNKSIIAIHYLKGSLLDLNSIALEEGPWPAKAYWDAEERSKQRAAGHYFDYGYTRPEVISRGPVASGMPTEGNRPTGGYTELEKRSGEPTPAEPKASDSNAVDSEFPDLDKRDSTKGSAPQSGSDAPRADKSNRNPSVRSIPQNRTTQLNTGASSSDKPSAAEVYNWGKIEMPAAPVVPASSNKSSLTDSRINSGSAQSTTSATKLGRSVATGNSPQWRAKATQP